MTKITGSSNLYPKLRKGDWRIIADITGMSARTVEGVVYGHRHNPKIKKAIKKYLEQREELEAELKSEFNPTF